MDFINDLNLADWVGIVGSFLISLAYFGVSSGRIKGEDPRFQILNLSGAFMILFSLWFRPNVGAIMIEVLWVVIAVYSLSKYWRKRR